MAHSDLSPVDLDHLRRCVVLAREALDAGDEPFGSVLVGPDGEVLHEERNRTGDGDQTRHPELDLARWAAAHVAPAPMPSMTSSYNSPVRTSLKRSMYRSSPSTSTEKARVWPSTLIDAAPREKKS